jgi:hypothetical protein
MEKGITSKWHGGHKNLEFTKNNLLTRLKTISNGTGRRHFDE